jgi:CDP-glycerol glycerophosphotransferase
VSGASATPRLSVVVPVHDVAPYLDECLESLARQTLDDLEVLMVDDGSTDESPEIAARFASRDGRFRLLRQENRGQGPARNTGLEQVAGTFVAFVDGDDVVPRRAYEALVGALERTRSDFSCGSVRRLTSLGTTRAEMLGDAFERERLETHVTRFPSLVVDRLACNKVFRRSFWERHHFRFPEGVRNEDIWVMLPAHFLARSVDVLRDTVYLWRRREGGDLSGSQRRSGLKALRDRVGAVDHVSRFVAGRGLDEAKLHYDRSVVANDLRYFLDIVDTGDDEFRELFLELANDFLDRADRRALDQPRAIERLKWELVRRRALPELVEVLGFQAERLAETPPLHQDGGWYGDYPHRTNPALALPPGVFRLEAELAPVARLTDLRWEGDLLRLEGYAYVEMIGAPEQGSQRLELVARSESGRRVPLPTETAFRPEVTAGSEQELVSLDWSAFVATLDPKRLRTARWRRGGRRRAGGAGGAWTIGAVLHAGGVERETWEITPAPLHALTPVHRSLGSTRAQAGPSGNGRLEVRLAGSRPAVRSCEVEAGVLRVAGELGRVEGGPPALSLKPRTGGPGLEYALDVDRAGFAASIPVDDLLEELAAAEHVLHAGVRGEDVVWDAHLVAGSSRRRLALHEDAPGLLEAVGDHEVSVEPGQLRNLRIVVRGCRPVVDSAAWSPAGTLTLQGSFLGRAGEYELALWSRHGGVAAAVSFLHEGPGGRFGVELDPTRIESLAGRLPLAPGRWEVVARPLGSGGPGRQALLGGELFDRLPLAAAVGRRQFRLGVGGSGAALLEAERDLEPDERGGFQQRRLRGDGYRASRGEAIRDVVLYECFGGRESSDSPRAIHEELVRRGAPLEHLWVVRDGACVPPATAAAVADSSRAYYEAYARARYVVANDHWPRWASRRPEQTWLQTWHGPPLKRLGRDLARSPKAVREYRRTVLQPAENWHYLVSPAPFASPILRSAFSERAELLETGLPRTDVLLRPDRDTVAREVRQRLGLPEGTRTVLYAPTYRDHLATGGRYRHGPLLDVRALATALGEGHVVLFRRHRLMVGSHAAAADGVLDVTAYPDATELLLAADVLVTDYSSAVFDFASLGRPMLFFTPDLDLYRDEVRGFSIDFVADAPGPLLRKAGDVAEALADPDGLGSEFAGRRERFVSAYCPLADGGAAARVVDRLFSA